MQGLVRRAGQQVPECVVAVRWRGSGQVRGSAPTPSSFRSRIASLLCHQYFRNPVLPVRDKVRSRGNLLSLAPSRVQLADQLVSSQMGVAFKHIHRPMTRNCSDLHNVQCTELEKATDGLVPKIMKMQIFDSEGLEGEPPCAFETG